MIRHHPYERHAAFVAPARPLCALWRFGAGLAVAVIAYLVLVQIFVQTAFAVLGRSGVSGQGVADPAQMYVMLASFACMALAVGLSARLLHGRGFMTLLGPFYPMIADFRAASTIIVVVLAAVFFLPPWDMGAPLVPNMPVGTWLALLLPSLFFVLVQTSAEEIVFRGYIQQQLAARFASPLIWMVLPSALFALGHYLPDMAGENAWIIALWSGVFGVLMADLTARAGTLGPAIAVHFWNNVSAILFVALPDGLSGLALYLAPFSASDAEAIRAWLPVEFVMMLVLWLAARLGIRR